MRTVSARFPEFRPRRLRRRASIRDLVRENSLQASDLIWPIFVHDGSGPEPVPSMPGVERISLASLADAARRALDLGIPAIALFPRVDPEAKTPCCEEAWNPGNLANRAVRNVKDRVPGIAVMLDVALDPYNSLGHDGLVSRNGEILNDETLDCLVKQALSHAEAGADILGPSDMMDGRIAAIRRALEHDGFKDIAIMSYSAKYASAFYGPFREAIGSAGALAGDKRSYQIDPGNSVEALRMVQRDLDEGADMVMVKPGMPYLDICRRVKDEFGVPTYAYQVSGEYAMLQAAVQNGWLDRRQAMLESLLAFKRAGCDGILTYFAVDAARELLRMSG